MSKTSSKHYTNIDILRILACFMVVTIHVAANKWFSVPVDSSDWAAMNLYDSAARSSVPLFFMISGMLFLNREKVDPISKLLKNNVLKLVIVYIVWAIFYAVDTVGVHALLSSTKAWGKLGPLIITGAQHLWFLPTMIGLYLLIPILFAFKEYQNGKYVRYALVLFFIFTILFTTVTRLFPEATTVAEILNKVKYELIGFSGYFILGYYLSKKDYSKIRKSVLILLYIMIVGIATFIVRATSINAGEPLQSLYGYMTLPVFFEAILLFVFFQKSEFKLSAKMSKFIALISKCTLGVYLLHPFMIEHLKQWTGMSTLSFNPWLSVPIISIAVFVLTLVAILILTKVPVVNKWLI